MVNCFVGYAISKDGIKNFNTGLGCDENSNSSVGIYAHSNYKSLSLFDDKHIAHDLISTQKPNNGSIIILSFDFNNNILMIYHNSMKGGEISLNGHKSIIPGVSLCYDGDSIDIIKCKISFRWFH